MKGQTVSPQRHLWLKESEREFEREKVESLNIFSHQDASRILHSACQSRKVWKMAIESSGGEVRSPVMHLQGEEC